MSKKYVSYSDKFKFKVALEALRGHKTVAELCQEFKLAPSQIYDWKKKLEEVGPDIFANKKQNKSDDAEIENLHKTIGKLKVECDFLAKALGR